MTNEFTPKFDPAGKVVLVNGASRGIGRACALLRGSGGMIVGVRSAADGAELTAEIEGMGRRALAVRMNGMRRSLSACATGKDSSFAKLISRTARSKLFACAICRAG